MVATALATGALGGCGSNEKLLPASDASAMDESFQRVADATNSGDCAAATSALADARKAFDALPSSVDAGLRERILAGIEQLGRTVPEQCGQAASGGELDTSQTTGADTQTTTTVEPPATTPPPEATQPLEQTAPPAQTGPAPDPGGVSPDVPPGPDGQGPPGQQDGAAPGQEGG